MTGTQRVLILLSDGKPRNSAEIGKALGMTPRVVNDAMKKLMRTGYGTSQWVGTLYGISPAGRSRLRGEKTSPDERAELIERRAKERAERAAIRNANARIRAEAAKTRCGSWPANWSETTVQAAMRSVPNSVFALGAGA